MVIIGNLFELAEKRLIREKKLGIISCYTIVDIIDYAIEIRRFLDRNPPSAIKKIMTLTKKELKIYKHNLRREKYLRTGY